ncbi:MAG: WD40 repeat domain-containing protein [Treponema sp.]|jgi:WD40 repeat protein|nr:WD40 repeat domain-containing protein [Treponema sp.]
MNPLKKKYVIIISVFVLLLYAFIAAAPVAEETVLVSRWIKSVETNYDEQLSKDEKTIPFELGAYFGYVAMDGRFSVNKLKKSYISLSDYYWSEYGARDETIVVNNPYNEKVFSIEDGYGYPFFLDSKSFIMGAEQNSISLLSTPSSQSPETVNIEWTYDFASPLTCVDAAAGFLLAGTLDGTIELIDSDGRRVFFSEPSGSRIAAVYGCALSKDGKKIAVVSGLDKQRFVLIEQFGVTWRITFHEFLEEGLRRNVYVEFVDNDNKIVFERESGLGIYDIKSRISYKIPLDGEITALDDSGDSEILFLITSIDGGYKKNLMAVKFPDTVIIEAPFNSESGFLTRKDNNLFVGGKTTLASFSVEKK